MLIKTKGVMYNEIFLAHGFNIKSKFITTDIPDENYKNLHTIKVNYDSERISINNTFSCSAKERMAANTIKNDKLNNVLVLILANITKTPNK